MPDFLGPGVKQADAKPLRPSAVNVTLLGFQAFWSQLASDAGAGLLDSGSYICTTSENHFHHQVIISGPLRMF